MGGDFLQLSFRNPEMLLTCVAGVCVGVRLGWGWTWDVTKKVLDLRVQKHVHFAKERGQDKE